MGLNATHEGRFWVWERQAWSSFGLLLSEGPCRDPVGEEKRRRGPSCCLESFSCSYTHFTGVGMGDLEGSPAFQGHPQGLCGTAHRPRGGGDGRGGEGREAGNARRTGVDGRGRLG